jgi:hypothetical protein
MSNLREGSPAFMRLLETYYWQKVPAVIQAYCFHTIESPSGGLVLRRMSRTVSTSHILALVPHADLMMSWTLAGPEGAGLAALVPGCVGFPQWLDEGDFALGGGLVADSLSLAASARGLRNRARHTLLAATLSTAASWRARKIDRPFRSTT